MIEGCRLFSSWNIITKPKRALHPPAILLRFIAAGELQDGTLVPKRLVTVKSIHDIC